MSCDLENAYLNATNCKKIWFEGSIECGEDKVKVLVVVQALYGLQSAGVACRAALAESLVQFGFKSTRADPYVWIRAAVFLDGGKYYEILFVYVDDILALSHKATEVIIEINIFYKAKEGIIKPPDIYLSANIDKLQMPDGREVWGSSSRDYVKNAIATVKRLFEEDGEGFTFRNSVKNLFPTGYKPELNVTEELRLEIISRYLQRIGICRWAVELGRIDIFLELYLLSQYQASPRLRHLEVFYNLFAYLKKHPDMGRLSYDSKAPDIDESDFVQGFDWKDFYGNVEEELPPRMPEPRGNPVIISAFIDADHAGNVVTRRSHTGIIIFVQNAPIVWFS